MINYISLCEFKRKEDSKWEVGLNIQSNGGNYVFDLNMEKPNDIWDVEDTDIININLQPLIFEVEKSINIINMLANKS
jgi:hypothetical protein